MCTLPEHVRNPDTSVYLNKDYLVLDFETTNIEKGNPNREDNHLVLACWNFRGKRYEKYASEYEQDLLLEHISQCSVIVAHNAKFECGWLLRCGWVPGTTPVYCTMIGQYVLNGNRITPLNLKHCTTSRGLPTKLDLVSLWLNMDVCVTEMPKSWVIRYCHRDVDITEQLFLLQRVELDKLGLLPVQYSRCLVTPILAEIEKYGMCLDEDRVDEVWSNAKEKEHLLLLQLETFTGGINLSSSQQLGEFLFDTLGCSIPNDYSGKPMLTPSGRPSTSVEAIAKIRPSTDTQKEFLVLYKEWNDVKNTISKYLDKMREACAEEGGIIRAEFNQCRTKTHRLSSTGRKYRIQYQNIQRDLKRCYRAREKGWYIGESDQGQLEFRVAVDLARDPQGIKDIHEKHDVHSFTASILSSKWESANDETRKKLRTAAKADTFKPLFGGNSGTPQQRKYYDAFNRRYERIAAMQAGWVDEALRTKKLVTNTGLIFYYPYCKLSRSGYPEGKTQIYNSPIQMFASAEITLLGLVCLWYRIRDLQSYLINTIHDSIISELHPDEVEVFSERRKQSMEVDVVDIIEKLYGYKIEVPLETSFDYSYHWTES